MKASLGTLSSFANLEQLRVKTMSSPCFLAKSVIRLKKNLAKKRLVLTPCMERSEAEEKKGPDTDFAQKQRLIVIYFPS